MGQPRRHGLRLFHPFHLCLLIPVPFYEREPYNNYICISAIILMLCVYAMSILSFDQAMKNVNREILLGRREQQLHYLEGQLVTHKESDAMVKSCAMTSVTMTPCF